MKLKYQRRVTKEFLMKIGFHIYHYFDIILEHLSSLKQSHTWSVLKGDVGMTSHLS